MALPESLQVFEVTTAQTSRLVNPILSCQTGFFNCKLPFIDKPMVINESSVPSAWLLGLGTNLYPSNIQRMLNKGFTHVKLKYARIEEAKERLC